MGNCTTSSEIKQRQKIVARDQKKNDNLDAQIQTEFEKERNIVKILLLGTGNSGKSTILKQFRLWKTDAGLGDMNQNKQVISQNITKGILVVATGIGDVEEVTVSLQPRALKIFQLLNDNNFVTVWDELELDGKYEQVGHLCVELWEDPATQAVMEFEGKLSMLEVPIEYFINSAERIIQLDYIPSSDDIFQARARTSGVVTIEFTLDKIMCRMVDVGGQRNERKKWISHFDNVTAIMFLVSLSEYDKFLLEDSTVNRMHDAMDVFQNIVECPYFEETNIILLLNKKDLFEEKLKKVDLSFCFPDYAGGSNYMEAVDFVQNKFLSIFREAKDTQVVDSMSSDIYPFQTMATNTSNVKTVFNMCKHIIFKNNLASTGML